jgi:general secretion pathway protein A
MYLSHYNLRRKPFSISPDPTFLWLSEKHKEALAVLKYGILDNKGFLVLTGDVGTGKTALIKALVKIIDVSAYVAAIPDPGLGSLDFFNFLAEEFKMEHRFKSKGDFLIYFKKFLYDAYRKNKRVLLIIDEAQRLNHELLEQIRLLSNIEKENQKLINRKLKLCGSELRSVIILIG